MTIFAVQKVDHLTILMEIDMIIKRDYYLNQLISSKHNGLIKIVTGLIPFFIIAGWIESFITRHADAYPVVGAAAILLSLGGVIGYFVLYPYYLYKNETNGKN